MSEEYMPKKISFDLDGTLCSHKKNYSDAEPYLDRIAKVNELYDSGNTILIDTARGSTTGIDWTEVTRKQLHSWGIKHHELRVGVKFEADVFVDDKALNSDDFFGERLGFFKKLFNRLFA